MAETSELPRFDRLWDYSDPAGTEAAFRELLPRAREAGNVGYEAELLTQIARCEGLQRNFEAAHRTLDEAARIVAENELRPVCRVRLLLERGRVFRSSKSPQKARPLWVEAWEIAAAAGEDFHAVDAAHMLGVIEPWDEAISWNLKAIAHAEASTQDRARGWLGALTNNLGWTYFDRKDYPRALDLLQRSQRYYAERDREREVRIARWGVAKVQRHLGRLEEALQAQEQLEREWAEAGSPDGYVHEELAECLSALGREEQAAPHFHKAWEILSNDSWLADNEPDRIQRLKEMGGG